MKKIKFKRYISLILGIIFLFNVFAYADGGNVVTLGKDLSDNEKETMLDLFNVKKGQVNIIEVNNKEERTYLEGIATEAQIGKKTLSSAYVELLEEGEGISVTTHNISWVTKEMYESALVTAGLKDAMVLVAAPFEVSGTGALTGIIKAFEEATGKKISLEQKRIASEEVVQSGQLGEDIGQEKASELIRIIKEEVLSKDIKDREDIKKVIIEIAGKLDINLNKDQIEKLSNLMEKINGLDLNTKEIKNQLKDIGKKLDDSLKNNEEVKSILEKILEAIKAFFKTLFS